MKFNLITLAIFSFTLIGPAKADLSYLKEMGKRITSSLSTSDVVKKGQGAGESVGDDSWGSSSMPFRGLEAQQKADERPLDDRFRDDRNRESHRKATQPSRGPVETKSSGVRNNSTARRSSLRTNVQSPSEFSGCSNLARRWESLAIESKQNTDKAFEGYLNLFRSCRQEEELKGSAWELYKNLGVSYSEKALRDSILMTRDLKSSRHFLLSQLAFYYNESNSLHKLDDISEELLEMAKKEKDQDVAVLLGWRQQAKGNPRKAEELFKLAISFDRLNSESAYEGLIQALLSQGKLHQAESFLSRVSPLKSGELHAQVLLEKAKRAHSEKNTRQAYALLKQAKTEGLFPSEDTLSFEAWLLKDLGQLKEAEEVFKELFAQSGKKEYSQGLAEVYISKGTPEKARELGIESERVSSAVIQKARDKKDYRTLASETGTTPEQLSAKISGGLSLRDKSGDEGEGQLRAAKVPVAEFEMPLKNGVVVSGSGFVLRLDDGLRSVLGREYRLGGSMPLNKDSLLQGSIGISDVGHDKDFTINLKYTHFLDSGKVSAGFYKEPVVESVRSYTGIASRAGTLGRVTKSALSFSGVHPTKDFTLEWDADAGSYSGSNVSRNAFVDIRAAAMRDVDYSFFSWLSIGPEIKLSQHTRDDNRFENGFGGYFSPKSNVELGARLRGSTQEGNKSLLRVDGSMGYVSRGLHYGNDSGLSLEANVKGAWLLSSHLIGTLGVGLKTSPGYSDKIFSLGVVIPLEKRTGVFLEDLKNVDN